MAGEAMDGRLKPELQAPAVPRLAVFSICKSMRAPGHNTMLVSPRCGG
jgi:hypothetical protein